MPNIAPNHLEKMALQIEEAVNNNDPFLVFILHIVHRVLEPWELELLKHLVNKRNPQ